MAVVIMRSTLDEFQPEVHVAVCEFWMRRPSDHDIVMICWTEEDDQLHGGFCQPDTVLGNLDVLRKMSDAHRAEVRKALSAPQYLNTHVARVIFFYDDGLEWVICEKPRAVIGAA